MLIKAGELIQPEEIIWAHESVQPDEIRGKDVSQPDDVKQGVEEPNTAVVAVDAVDGFELYSPRLLVRKKTAINLDECEKTYKKL